MPYDELDRRLRWQVPEHFNFAVDVADRLGADPGRVALYWENDAGHKERRAIQGIPRTRTDVLAL